MKSLYGNGIFHQNTFIRSLGKGTEISGKIVPHTKIPKVHFGIFDDLQSTVGIEGFQKLDDIGFLSGWQDPS